MRDRMAAETDAIEREVIINDDQDVIALKEYLDDNVDAVDDDTTDRIASVPSLEYSAILAQVSAVNKTVNAYLDAFCDIVCPDDTNDNDEVCDGPDVADDVDEIINALEAVVGLVTERASDDDQYGHVNTSDDQVDVLRSPHIGSTDVDN
ncbi:hypothetical protein SDRG_16726 [Saprolegnia diclina VS20]|uniref:Uncharacterized protein n=1 Tax=Saprolegnia diclina (strain VS20) TaxID=1156394 RepID=T0PJ42_SAPDV|nr:hypothetical protein SDRG_16726 [Saprolegnia diclina VS20]EQC25399.1 hypothetical protein SDRG_16726 [Saprolegnia diclina VS20]|eukprot:XP_008621166.1 hypothetical protein SDRG_16726 [Saprolegnia diclina VS20]